MSSHPIRDAPRCGCHGHAPDPAVDPALALVMIRMAVVTVALRALPFGRVVRWVLGVRGAGRTGCPTCLARRVSRAAVPMWPRGSCLSRSLVLARLLRLHGEDASVVIGVVGGRATFTAHAWVELAGRPFGPDSDHTARYDVLCRLTGADRSTAGSPRGGP